MAKDPARALLAIHRFGLGPKPGTLAAMTSDPSEALLADLRAGTGRLSDGGLMSSADVGRELSRTRQALKAKKAGTATPPAAGEDKGQGAVGVRPADILSEEAEARFEAAARAKIGFVERLVWFWSNHLCVAAGKGGLRALAGAFEREAIRPHVLGRFADMLIAAESHPAMLLYLDNLRSIGPNSAVGLQRDRGLNENLARETLELHTLGVRSGYTQEDVTSLAKVLTGWAVTSKSDEQGTAFVFDPRRHEPGPQRVLGKSYPDTGVEQGRAVLRDIARHPATARHIAGKLARHFISDEPSPALVEALATRFLETDGDLKELATALVSRPEALDPRRTKLRRPSDWLAAIWRAGDTEPETAPAMRMLTTMGEPLWRPPAPKGFSDASSDWTNGLPTRMDVAGQVAEELGTGTDARALLDATLGPLASAETRQAIARAESGRQALVLLFMAPEMQRR